MTPLEALKARHSVRKYQDRPIEKSTIDLLQTKINEINKIAELHIQLVTDEVKAFSGLLAYGSFSGVSNYLVMIGRESDTLEHNVGYYGEQLVLYAQELGLRTCWVGLTYKKVPGVFVLFPGEKVVCCIAIGYGADDGRQSKSKRPDQVSNAGPATPEWFARGVEGALLAPTAVNQQKFYFTYIPPRSSGEKPCVKAERKFSLVGYTKIDLGIAMYNFEVAAGVDNFTWL